MPRVRLLLLVAAAVSIAGCAYTAQRVNLNPAPQVAGGNLGKGHPVFVHAVDERKNDVLGHRAVGSIGAEIRTAQDVATVVGDSLSKGLRQLGFTPTGQLAPGTPELRVEIRNLDYLVSQGFWSGGLTVDVSMKAICIVGESRPYEQMHRGHYEVNIQVVQTQGENEEYINAALTQAIESVLRDAPLMSCLAGG